MSHPAPSSRRQSTCLPSRSARPNSMRALGCFDVNFHALPNKLFNTMCSSRGSPFAVRPSSIWNATFRSGSDFFKSIAIDRAISLKSTRSRCISLRDNRFNTSSPSIKSPIRTASQRMGLLIDGLLVLNRLSRSEMHRERVDLSEIARSIAMDLKKSDPERNVAFQIEDGLTANGDPRLLHIVLNNLFGNAWKFTSKHPSARIEFGRAEREGKQVLCLRDDGAGFDMAYASKLFGPFQRLHGVHEFDGTGIGLATAQRIIHRPGGKIWAESAIQKGAAFYFTL